jgi:hypothetical protein
MHHHATTRPTPPSGIQTRPPRTAHRQIAENDTAYVSARDDHSLADAQREHPHIGWTVFDHRSEARFMTPRRSTA